MRPEPKENVTMATLDELDRVVRERLIGSPPHSLQHLGTLEKLNYLGTVGRITSMGTLAVLGTVLLSVHAGTLDKVNRIGTQKWLGTVNRIGGGRVGTLGRLGTVHYVERVGTISNIGSINYIGTLNRVAGGRIGTLGRLGTAHYVERIGTVEHLGTLMRVGSIGWLGTARWLGTVNRVVGGRLGTLGRVGTIHYVQRIGTIHHLGSVGRIGTAHTGSVPVSLTHRHGVYSAIRDRTRLGPGSTWVGSWQHIGSYNIKTSMFNIGNPGTSGGGSLALITGVTGTGAGGGTGTYYGPVRIGKGTYNTFSFTEAFRYLRPWIRQHGGRAPGTFEHGGTVSMHLGLIP